MLPFHTALTTKQRFLIYCCKWPSWCENICVTEGSMIKCWYTGMKKCLYSSIRYNLVRFFREKKNIYIYQREWKKYIFFCLFDMLCRFSCLASHFWQGVITHIVYIEIVPLCHEVEITGRSPLKNAEFHQNWEKGWMLAEKTDKQTNKKQREAMNKWTNGFAADVHFCRSPAAQA